MLAAGALTATEFSTESCCDSVTIGGTRYAGTSGPQSVRVAENELFTWQADYSVTNSGWVLCWRQTGTEPAPTTTTTTTMTINDFDNDFEPVYIILIVMAVGLMVCICICAHQKKKKRSAVLAATADQAAVRRAGWGPRLLKKLTHQDDKVADSPPNCLGSACCCFSCLCLNEDRMTPPTAAAKCCNPVCVVLDHEGLDSGAACKACCCGAWYTLCCWTPMVYTSYSTPTCRTRRAHPCARRCARPTNPASRSPHTPPK